MLFRSGLSPSSIINLPGAFAPFLRTGAASARLGGCSAGFACFQIRLDGRNEEDVSAIGGAVKSLLLERDALVGQVCGLSIFG